MTNDVVISARPAGDFSDPVLEELSEAAEADEELFRPMGPEAAQPQGVDADPDPIRRERVPAPVHLHARLRNRAGKTRTSPNGGHFPG
jgi:hypothetical protein